jgi:hypothetical protein
LVPRPAVITRTSDSTGPALVCTCQPPPDRVIARICASSRISTPRAGTTDRSRAGHRGHVGEPGVDVQPAAVGRELREALGQQLAPAGPRGAAAAAPARRSCAPRTRVHVGGHARLDQVQAAAVDEQPLAGPLLQVQPEPPGLEGQPRVLRIEVVVAHRPGQPNEAVAGSPTRDLSSTVTELASGAA